MTKKAQIKNLTKAEEQIMQVLWKIQKGFIKNIVEELPNPKPAYNTVSTIVRILENKGFINHIAYGKTHEYYPVIKKEEYSKFEITNLVKEYFEDSFEKMVSFFAKEKNISVRELDELIKVVEQLKTEKK